MKEKLKKIITRENIDSFLTILGNENLENYKNTLDLINSGYMSIEELDNFNNIKDYVLIDPTYYSDGIEEFIEAKKDYFVSFRYRRNVFDNIYETTCGVETNTLYNSEDNIKDILNLSLDDYITDSEIDLKKVTMLESIPSEFDDNDTYDKILKHVLEELFDVSNNEENSFFKADNLYKFFLRINDNISNCDKISTLIGSILNIHKSKEENTYDLFIPDIVKCFNYIAENANFEVSAGILNLCDFIYCTQNILDHIDKREDTDKKIRCHDTLVSIKMFLEKLIVSIKLNVGVK